MCRRAVSFVGCRSPPFHKAAPAAEEAQEETKAETASQTDQEMLLKLLANPEMAALLKTCSPNYLALAQHYGFRTEMIDITNDLKTALFFGCCKYINGKWKPLEKKDIEERYSRKGTIDSRYGVLYITRTEIMDMQYLLSNEDWDNIVPIGYQPFMRCSKQHGFMLLPHNAESYDIIRTRVDYVSPKKLNHINQVFTIEKVLSKMDVEPAYSPYIII